MSGSPEDTEKRIKKVLEDQLARIDTPQQAESVVNKVEKAAKGTTEEERASIAAKDPAPAAVSVERAASGSSVRDVAATIVEATSQAVASTPEAAAVSAGAHDAMGASKKPKPRAERGLRFLRAAALRRMQPFDRLDAKIFLAINSGEHPPGADNLTRFISTVTRGGWIWILGVLAARQMGIPISGNTLRVLIPSIVVPTLIVDYPVKAFFRRRRPFLDVIRAVVIGRKLESWSFPSGHSASSFAAAWTLTRIWPRGGPIFFSLASLVGFCRIYVGVHYPGDVLSGAICGMTLAELVRRLAPRIGRMIGSTR